MNTFRRLFTGLRAQLRSRAHDPCFDAARTRHAVFAGHHGVRSVLGLFAAERAEDCAEKDALTLAILAEQQARPSPFWSSVLLVAYYPMLSSLRHRIYGDALALEDLDQLVVSSFLGVVAEYPVDGGLDRTVMRLRQRTQRVVFAAVKAEQKDQHALVLGDLFEYVVDRGDTGWPDTSPEPGGRKSPDDVASALSLLVEHGSEVLDGEGFDMMTATLVCGLRISAYLERALPGLDEEDRRRLYPRIKRRHSRALARLRPVLAHLRCPRDGRSLLCLEGDHESHEEITER